MSQHVYIVSMPNFKSLSGRIFAYWLPKYVCDLMRGAPKLQTKGEARQGLSTSDNNRFLRLWHEVKFDNIEFCCTSVEETKYFIQKWYPYCKGGAFRKWSPINEYVVNFKDNGSEIKKAVLSKYTYLKTPDFVVKNTDFYFRQGVTWNDVSTGTFCARYINKGYIFADAGPMFFSKDDSYILGYFNSCVFQYFADIICQGMHYSTGQIPEIPYIEMVDSKEIVHKTVDDNYRLSKTDWDSFETSWEFKKHPLI